MYLVFGIWYLVFGIWYLDFDFDFDQPDLSSEIIGIALCSVLLSDTCYSSAETPGQPY